MLKTKDEIKSWLDQMKVTNYIINDDLTVDVNAWVDLSGKDLDELPVQFGIVNGCFSVWNNNLTSLKGSPIKVTESFNCSKNELTSLEYCPKEVGHVFGFGDNQITSFEHAPNSVGTLSLHGVDFKSFDFSHAPFMQYFKHSCNQDNFIPQFKHRYDFHPTYHENYWLQLTSQEFHAILLADKLRQEIPQRETKDKKIKV